MTTIRRPICLGCVHFRPEAPSLTCDAYPDGIPEAILTSTKDHRQPYEGDQGVQFEPKDADAAAYPDELFG